MKRRYPVSSSTRTRAAAVGRGLGSCCAVLVTAVSVTNAVSTLPPKQCCYYQVEFGGEIRLACGSGRGIGTHHQQATFRKRPEIPAGQMTQPAADLVAHHSAPHGPAHHEAHPRRLIMARLPEQVAGDQFPPGAAAAAHRPRELRALPHPCRCGKHRRSPRAGAGPGPEQVRHGPAHAPYGAGRPGWRGPRGCACAAGTRASWRGGGCSAGTYAYSLELQGNKARSSTSGPVSGHAKASPARGRTMNGTRAGHRRSNRARDRGRRLGSPGAPSGARRRPAGWLAARQALSPGDPRPGRLSTTEPVPSVTVAVCQTHAEPWP